MSGYVGLADPATGIGTLPATGYGVGQTQITSSSISAGGSLTASLQPPAGKTSYLCGFHVTGCGATAASAVAVTVFNALGGNLSYVLGVPAGATVAATPLMVTFNPPIQASAAGANLNVFTNGFGTGNTNSAIVAWGYYI